MLVATAALLGSAVSPAAAGEELSFKIAKRKSGPYGLVAERTMAEGAKRSFYIKARNTSTDPLSLELYQVGPTPPGYVTKYFRSDKNITSAMVGGGHVVNLGPDRKKVFRMQLKRTAGSLVPLCLSVRIEDPMIVDTVAVNVNDACE